MANLNEIVWDNAHLTVKTKKLVCQECVSSTLLYGSNTCALYAKHTKQLNSVHMRCLRKILYIKWKDKVTNGGAK
jgi:hypothetical protein